MSTRYALVPVFNDAHVITFINGGICLKKSYNMAYDIELHISILISYLYRAIL